MYFLVYKTTNKINGKCYVGSHKTENLDDGYLGSGKYLLRAIEKHGSINFVREILFQFDNPKDMYAKEAEIVNEDFLMNENTYNLKIGGYGGFDHINKTMSRKKRSSNAKKSYNGTMHTKEAHSKAMKTRWADPSQKKNLMVGLNWTGRKHSEETKRKISEARKRRLQFAAV